MTNGSRGCGPLCDRRCNQRLPSSLVRASPGKYRVLWKVMGARPATVGDEGVGVAGRFGLAIVNADELERLQLSIRARDGS